MIKFLIMKFRSWFSKKPTQKLTWSCEDYVMGKKWALSQPHPFKQESTYTIDNLNKFLFNEM